MSLRVLTALLALMALGVSPGGSRPARAQTSGQSASSETSSAVEAGSQLRVWLVTAGPGDAVWERYGHNAIRVLDTVTGRDVSYNWGIFDFNQIDFIPRFLRGRMLYLMAPFPTQPMLDSYARADRGVVLQELNLTPSQKLELRDFADRNALPENRDYAYQYFLDNCSTRVRDLLDLVLGGSLRADFESRPAGISFRDHIHRLTQVDPLIFAGLDLVLGTRGDRPISVWEDMFVPMTLRDALRDVTVVGPDGVERPLVLSEQTILEASQPREPTAPPRWFVIYAVLGLLLGGVVASSATEGVRTKTALRRAVATVTVVWSLLGGILGTILVLVLFTDHIFMYWNENLFLFNPLMLVIAVLIPLSTLGERWRVALRATVTLVAGIAILGLLWQLAPASRHTNAMSFALALPAHLGLAWATITRPA